MQSPLQALLQHRYTSDATDPVAPVAARSDQGRLLLASNAVSARLNQLVQKLDADSEVLHRELAAVKSCLAAQPKDSGALVGLQSRIDAMHQAQTQVLELSISTSSRLQAQQQVAESTSGRVEQLERGLATLNEQIATLNHAVAPMASLLPLLQHLVAALPLLPSQRTATLSQSSHSVVSAASSGTWHAPSAQSASVSQPNGCPNERPIESFVKPAIPQSTPARRGLAAASQRPQASPPTRSGSARKRRKILQDDELFGTQDTELILTQRTVN